MPQKIDVSMPQDLDLDQGWTLRVTAVDSTGATVSAVKAGAVAITAEALGVGTLNFGPFLLVPGPGAG